VSGGVRFEVRPVSGGSHGVYDTQDRRWVGAWTGPYSRETAARRLRERGPQQQRDEPVRARRRTR
jgi:hypothetical protein